MLSKEEIEKAKDDFKFFNEGEYITKEMADSKYKIIEYIDQLETDKQKLIEKLEEKISLNKSFNDCTYCNNTCNSYAICKFAQEILSIVKGVENENNKT